jgi:HD-like signal output (HDOD) protein
MALMKVEKLMPGMVLSEDVIGANARLLLTKGLELGDKHLRILKMWGVFEVFVDAPDSDDSNDALTDSEHFGMISEDVKKKFSNLDSGHPAISEILRLSICYRLEHQLLPGAKVQIRQADTPDPSGMISVLADLDRLEIKLPEVPSLVFELNEIIADPMSSSGDIAQVVNKSPSLSAMLLKIVNSAFYGFRSKVDSISRAVMMIGSKEVSNLALGITIMETFKEIPRQIMDVASFMEHNLACGIVARIIAGHSAIAHSEQLFVSGMLHDIGRLILCKYFPKLAIACLADADSNIQSLLKTELSLAKCTHMQIGKKLLKKWKLPYSLENNIFYHHNPSSSPSPETAAAVQLADIIVHGLGVGSSGEQIIPAFDHKAWEKMKLSVGAFNTVIHQAGHQIETFRHVFNKG